MICDDSKSKKATLSSVLLAKAKGGCVFERVEEEFGSVFGVSRGPGRQSEPITTLSS